MFLPRFLTQGRTVPSPPQNYPGFISDYFMCIFLSALGRYFSLTGHSSCNGFAGSKTLHTLVVCHKSLQSDKE